jgi:hypothetical protein
MATNKAGVKMPVTNSPGTMVMLEYIGKSVGRHSLYGEKTGIRYAFGAGKVYIYVDATDAPGMLLALDNHQKMFREYVAPKIEVPVPPMIPYVAQEPETEEVVAPVKRTRKAKVI